MIPHFLAGLGKRALAGRWIGQGSQDCLEDPIYRSNVKVTGMYSNEIAFLTHSTSSPEHQFMRNERREFPFLLEE
jgi:hypothetical protein